MGNVPIPFYYLPNGQMLFRMARNNRHRYACTARQAMESYPATGKAMESYPATGKAMERYPATGEEL